MRSEGKDTLLTFGGAHSNHIAAVAAAGKEQGFKTIGIIRGEELEKGSNPTLRKAAAQGMRLHFISRERYRRKHEPEMLQHWKQEFGEVYMVPEGGANEAGTRGCEDIVKEIREDFDFIVCACGTGSTLAGIIRSLPERRVAIGIPVLADAAFLETHIRNMLPDPGTREHQWKLVHDYHFGRYGAVPHELSRFVKDFYSDTGIPLDRIYTGKMMYGVLDLMEKGMFLRGEKVIALHTGGLQGDPIT